MKTIIDAETGRWLNNKAWIAVLGFVCAFVFYCSNIVGDVEALKKHVDAYSGRLATRTQERIDQNTFNTIVKKDIDKATEHRDRIEVALNKQSDYLKQLNEHLINLKLIKSKD